MSFTTATKEKPATTRYALVRLEGARYVVDELEHEGSHVYSMTVPWPAVARVERAGIALTKVSSLDGTADRFSFDETTRELRLKLAATPDEDDPIVVFFYLFFSGGETAHFEDPTDYNTARRFWEPRLQSNPKVAEGFKNITSGIFTYEETDFAIVNRDHYFERFLGPQDSFYQKDMTVWFVVDGEIERLYVGRISKVTLDSGQVSFRCFDVFSRLSQPLLMGDSRDKAFFFRSAASFPDLDPGKSGRPCRYVFGASSPAAVGGTTTTAGKTLHRLMLDFTEEATNISWMPSDQDALRSLDAENRTWALCRIGPDGLKTLDFGTMSSFSNNQTIYNSFLTARDDNLEIGDIFKHVNTSAETNYWLVNRIIDNPGGGNRAIFVECLRYPFVNEASFPRTVGFDGTGTFYTNDAPLIWADGRRMVPYLDFDWSTEALASGNLVVKITFTASPLLSAQDIDSGTAGISNPYGWRSISTDVYERSFPGDIDFIGIDAVYRSGTPLTKSSNLSANDEWTFDTERRRLRVRVASTPTGGGYTADFRWRRIRSDSDVRYVVRTADANLNHADALRLICERCGLNDFDAASFAAAESALSAKVRFTIPFRGSSIVETARSYAEHILASTVGFLRMNADREVEYQLVTGAPAPSAARSDVETLAQSVTAQIDYEDIATRVVATNEHMAGVDGDGNPAGYAAAESFKAACLHGIEREIAMDHVLDDISGRIDVIMALRANRAARYRFDTATIDLDSYPGDDVELQSRAALGGGGATDLKVIRTSKAVERVELLATDLLGL